ncbi:MULTISPECIES: restriction endonuclease subunit S [Exiguobacterium]|uniref:restriction endonuclease subunit S n=1 Tax=Exiguobacterium TaxID=33986 RepID=UPI001BE92219|nr:MULTISPECIES: restriction endonuclease subunit S [Exiguobacterium]MBQ6458296.1 restriction endonuclease subunit S [Exiguobacterium sp.]MCM3280964.1 restriction endonuclease subunit S [Exiguobacterium sp. MER 193]
MFLGDIAEIKTGIVLTRKKVEVGGVAKATYRLITLKNITENGLFNDEPFELFQSSDVLSPQHFTEEGDVLIRLSYPHTSVYIDASKSGLLVPSYFAVIKVDEARFLPEFVAWYLNREIVKKELERSQAGTRIPSTNKTALSAIPFEDIPIERQQALIKLCNLHQQEKALYNRLIDEKEKWFNAMSKQILQGEPKEEL